MLIAPNYTKVAAGQTGAQIAAGKSITVYGVSVQSTALALTNIMEVDGTAIFDITNAANGTSVVNTPFVAPRGITVTTPATGTCTVFHSNAT